MDIGKEPRRESGLPNLNALDPETLKAIVLSQQAEIENLKLLVLKLKRMHFGAKSEKLNADIEQLELRLEELEANQAAADPCPFNLPLPLWLRRNPHAARFPRNCLARRKQSRRNRRPAPIAAASCARSVRTCLRCWNTFRRASK